MYSMILCCGHCRTEGVAERCVKVNKRLPTDRVAVRCSHKRNSRTYVLDPEPGEAVFVVKAGTEVALLRESDSRR